MKKRGEPRASTWKEEQKYKANQVHCDAVIEAIRSGGDWKTAVENLRKELAKLGGTEVDYQLILERGTQDTVLHAAAQNGDTKLFEEMADNYGLVSDRIQNLLNAIKQTILFSAVRGGNLKMVEHLINNYSLNPHAMDSDEESGHAGESLLHVAARWGHHEIFRYLAEEKGVKDRKMRTIGSAVIIAVRNGRFEMAKMLINEFGYDPNIMLEKEGSLLHVVLVNKRRYEKSNPNDTQTIENYKNIIQFLKKEKGARDLPPKEGSVHSILTQFSREMGSIPESPLEEMMLETMEVQPLQLSPVSSSTDVSPGHTPTNEGSNHELFQDVVPTAEVKSFYNKVERIMTQAFYRVRTFNSGDKDDLRRNVEVQIKLLVEDPDFRKFILKISVNGERTLGFNLLTALQDQEKGVIQRGCFFSTIEKNEAKLDKIIQEFADATKSSKQKGVQIGEY